MAAGSVCIVSPGNLASNPRLVKEADALQAAGYDVTAVVLSHDDALGSFDAEIAGRVAWRVRRAPRVRADRYARYAARPVARALAAVRALPSASLAAAAYGGPTVALQWAVAGVRADLYVAHYIAALPAAAAAAHRHGGMLGFDAEDFHSGEGTGGSAEDFRMRMAARVEAATLPDCAHMTAASPLIARAYAERYGVAPVSVLNVFPVDMAPDAPSSLPSPVGQLRAYWFSQTIGLDRGLQSFMRAMARARAEVILDIRGGNAWGHGDTLRALAEDLGIGDQVRLLAPAPPDEMVRLAASYDIGLSLELQTTESRRLCLTNKIFTYLLAGVPVMMSDTPAQRALAPELGAAAALVSLSDPDGMASALDRLASSPRALAEAKAMAWRLGRQRYNWDVEKDVLLESVSRAFESRRAACRP